MYSPPQFAEDRPERLTDFMVTHPFAALVTTGPDGLFATHLPLLFDPDPAPYGTLNGHVAKANPQWRHLDGPALAIFSGPAAYVSPGWYATKRETSRVVPTWNYVAVHAAGRLTRFDEPQRLRLLLDRLTARHEGAFTNPWQVSDAPTDFVTAQLKGIVGVALCIERLHGKWKLSQNRPPADRAGVAAGLAASPDPMDRTMAALMADRTTG